MLPYAELHDAVGVLPSGTRGGPYLTPRPERRPQITAVPNYYEREQPGANFDKLLIFRRTNIGVLYSMYVLASVYKFGTLG